MAFPQHNPLKKKTIEMDRSFQYEFVLLPTVIQLSDFQANSS